MEERDQQRKERRALIEAEKQRKEEARLVSCLFFDGLFLVFFFYLVINWVDSRLFNIEILKVFTYYFFLILLNILLSRNDEHIHKELFRV